MRYLSAEELSESASSSSNQEHSEDRPVRYFLNHLVMNVKKSIFSCAKKHVSHHL